MDDVHLLITIASVVGAAAFFGAGFFLRRAPVTTSPAIVDPASLVRGPVRPRVDQSVRPPPPVAPPTPLPRDVEPGTPLPQVLRRLVEDNGATGALMCTHDGLVIDATDGIADDQLGALVGLIGQLSLSAAADGLLGTTRTLEVQGPMWGTVRCRFSGDPGEPRILASVGPDVQPVPHVEEAAFAAVDGYVAA